MFNFNSLEKFKDNFSSEILDVRSRFLASLNTDKSFTDYLTLQDQLLTLPPPECLNLDKDCIQIGKIDELSTDQHQLISSMVKTLMPWRIGPYELFGLNVESEWQSGIKWSQLEPHLPPLSGKRILDVGANNGYFLFRLLKHNPNLLLGIDPVRRAFLQHHFLSSLIRDYRVCYEPLSVLDLELLPKQFDCIICMGVLYHQKNPLLALRKMKDALVDGGTIILESLTIPGKEPVALFPPDRYAKMRNAWMIPTGSCLSSWLTKTGFKDVELVGQFQISTDEQHRTVHSPDESLTEFLDSQDQTKTVEGFPAPIRTIVRALL